MSTLREYLVQKRSALLALREKAAKSEPGPHDITARTKAEGRSGVRRLRIRDHVILSDSPYDFAGYNFGPTSPELAIGVLSTCLTHIFLIQAADRQVPLDSLEVEVHATQDGRSGSPGFENVPRYPHNINYTVHITSTASAAEISELHAAVEKVCPILNLLINPQEIRGYVRLNETQALPESVASSTGAHKVAAKATAKAAAGKSGGKKKKD
jgi:uncharacterized OsmC-like protein